MVPGSAHLMGGSRMGKAPSTSDVNEFCRRHDIPNLYICDDSVIVTSRSAKTTETEKALEARTADQIIAQGK